MRFYAPSQARSVKDIAGFTKMKYRLDGQGNKLDLAGKDARAELEERETQHFSKLSKEEFLSERDRDLKLLGVGDGRRGRRVGQAARASCQRPGRGRGGRQRCSGQS